MIPHVRNDSRAGLGVIGGGTFGHGGSGHGLGRNGVPVTEMSATVEVSIFMSAHFSVLIGK